MIRTIYAVKDDLQGFLAPVADVNDQIAVRNFLYMVRNSKEMMSNASDFSFYRIGAFDTDTGLLDPAEPLVYLCRGSDVNKGDVDE